MKPQLEKALNLPPDSLTKEIKLTQELMKLFVKYQIPTDLLTARDEDVANLASGGAAQQNDSWEMLDNQSPFFMGVHFLY